MVNAPRVLKIDIVNQQRIKKIAVKKLKASLEESMSFLAGHLTKFSGSRSGSISVVLCDNNFIAGLNKKYLKKNTPTDVIAFELRDPGVSDYIGEVFVSVQEAVLRSPEYGLTWQKELTLYIIHGILHLAGYRDSNKEERKSMEAKQQEILRKIFG
ncbi:MAG: rRNA maturation RNase YbeY [Candidatus Omnitrophica bacterium]|nr:rRNA maturation RNase YbeY [Candidatus Omnitrophota bacterium]MDD5430237.1 rRNA maturation RNase YbeY [Candidatus Omnitrophota bacterium]